MSNIEDELGSDETADKLAQSLQLDARKVVVLPTDHTRCASRYCPYPPDHAGKLPCERGLPCSGTPL